MMMNLFTVRWRDLQPKELRSKYFSTVEFKTSGDTELLYNILIQNDMIY